MSALGLSLSVDAFAAAVGKGASGVRHRFSDALRIGAIFGFFEAITPAIGWAIGLALSSWVAAVDHWIAFALLLAVGGHMISHALSDDDKGERQLPKTDTQRIGALVATALATSIDATAVGISLAVMGVNILTACIIIGAVTTVMATVGVLLGRKAGAHLGKSAEVLGGVALILIGASILYQHMWA